MAFFDKLFGRKPVAAGTPDPPLDKTSSWVKAQIAENAPGKDQQAAVRLAEACATLSGHGTMLFGMVAPKELANRESLRQEAVRTLGAWLPTLSNTVVERVAEINDTAKLGLQIEPALARIAEHNSSWIASKIHEHEEPQQSSQGAHLLAQACVALSGGAPHMVFGMVLPKTLRNRDRLLAQATEALARWVPKLDTSTLDSIEPMLVRANVPIDFSARREQLRKERADRAAQRRAGLEAGSMRNVELEERVLDALDDKETYLVLGDWLQQQGDPRGELIALQTRGETEPKAKQEAARHLEENAATFLGPLAEFTTVRDGTENEAFTWRRGFIHSARFSFPDGDEDLGEVIEILLGHPSGRFLSELTLGMAGESGASELQSSIDVIAANAPAALRKLHLGAFDYPDQCEISWYDVGDLGALWRALPRLAHIEAQGSLAALGDIASPTLERFEIRTGNLPRACAVSIAAMTTPKLQHLDVWFGDPSYGGDTEIGDLRPLFAREDLPALRHLGIRNAAFTDEVCALLPTSALLSKLESLDLSMGTMSDAGARVLAAHADAFRHLKRIDVSHSFLSKAGQEAIRKLCPSVIFGEQREQDDDSRYVAVGE